MRILFDGFWWAEGPVSNRQVMREFVLAWEARFPEDEVVLAVRNRDLDVVRADVPARIELVGTRLSPQGVSAIVELPWLARRVGADLTLTHNFTPAFGRSAVFVHDFMFLTSPEWFTFPERCYFALMPATIRRSRIVFTSSATEAERIRRYSGSRPVVPVGLAVGRGLRDATPRRPRGIEEVSRFHLSVGRLNARKNLETAIIGAVASGLVAPLRPLLVVGEPGGRGITLSAAEAAVADGTVRMMGRLDDEELAWLYANTDGLVFLSLDEGFGMPTLEALEFGSPILASDIPVFHEILGDRAVYVDPSDPVAVAEGLRSLPPRPADGRRSAEEQGYSWARSVATMRAEVVARLEAPSAAAAAR
ncbi:glycosyltransferase family 4 protein [Agromyces sp. MMS24-K17]|uniref:glycosyltransferase family 4 protein n=1 Tax=Agromyces sp. MMS24-K17 TaxID=3372850 RepID=UPI00375439C7